MPQTRLYRSNAARQRAYRLRKKLMSDQPRIFDDAPDWQEHWTGMPEFVQEEKPEPYATIIFRVATREDLEALFESDRATADSEDEERMVSEARAPRAQGLGR